MCIAERKRALPRRNIPLTTSSFLPKKSVSFNQSVKVYLTLHIRDYTHQQICDTWYSAEEQATRISNIHADLKMAELGIHHDQPSFCTRGLEYFTRSEHERRQQRRRDAFDTVLRIQGLQKLLGYRDDTSLANDYARQTAESQQVARRIGMADEHYVYNYYNFER